MEPASEARAVHRVDRLLATWRQGACTPPSPPLLDSGAHVAVVGAGPAGSFAAHFLRQHARELGIDLRLTIFDAKDFTRSGPAGCNMCAGMVTRSLLDRMGRSGLELPSSVEQDRVSGVRIVTRGGTVRLRREGAESAMVTVFRGNGPRLWPGASSANISFDDALLTAVSGDDLEVIREPVTDIRLPEPGSGRAVLVYGRGRAKQQMEADLVIGAFGADNRLGRLLATRTRYRPPRTVRACQAELLVGRDHIREVLGGEIQVFNLGMPDVSFAALVPKGDFVTATMIGRRDLGLDDLLGFLDLPRVRAYLPRGWEIPRRFCHCHPGVVVSHARHPFADRLVMVGDAACCRYYKNGLETAYDTAALAAFAAMRVGVSSRALGGCYARTAHRLVNRDNYYGKLLFAINSVVARSRRAARAFVVLCRAPGAGSVGEALRDVLWSLFAGDRPYGEVLLEATHPRVVAAAAWQVLRHVRRRPLSPT